MFIERVSHSKLDSYRECHWKYFAKYHEKLPEHRSDTALQFGSYIHKICERGVSEFTLSGLEKIALEERKNYKFDSKDYSDKKITKCLVNFLEFNTKIKGENMGLELNETVRLTDVDYNGIIDRVIKSPDGSVLIIDYKTSKSEKTKLDLYSDFQLIGYAVTISENYKIPLSKITCAHFYPITGNFVSISYNKSHETKFKSNVKNIVWAIRKKTSTQLLPIRNKFCNWCSFQYACPLFVGNETSQQILKEHKEKIKTKKEK